MVKALLLARACRAYRRVRRFSRVLAGDLWRAAQHPGLVLAHLRHSLRSLVYLTPILGGLAGRSLAGQDADGDDRRIADGGGPFPDGVRRVVPARLAAARARRRLP